MDETQARRLVEVYSDMIVRISCSYLKCLDDAEDVCQTVLLKRLTENHQFDSDEHEKAWMIRTTINTCKDYLKSAFVRRTVPLEEAMTVSAPTEQSMILLDALKSLPEKYRVALYLYYYEDYTLKEIAEILKKRENTVAAWLSRGRQKLRCYLSELEQGGARDEG